MPEVINTPRVVTTLADLVKKKQQLHLRKVELEEKIAVCRRNRNRALNKLRSGPALPGVRYRQEMARVSTNYESEAASLERELGSLRLELARATYEITEASKREQAARQERNDNRRSSQAAYLKYLQDAEGLSPEDPRRLIGAALQVFRRLRDAQLLLPEEVKYMGPMDAYMRKEQANSVPVKT